VAGAKIMLDDRMLGGNFTRQFLSATDVFETARLAAADGTGPLVVLNACQAGLGGEQLSSLGGFARAFLDAGAQAFVACLWSVKQQPSRVFVECLYEQLIAGAPLAQAVSSARDEARTPEDPATWLAYAVYGRPDATLVLQ
jgi:CHAT domain-containing protein